MSIKLGSTSIGSLYLGSTKIGAAYLGSTKIYESSPSPVDPLNPLGLPPYTIRVKLASGYTPSAQTGVTQTLVDATENIWDYYKNQNSSNFNSLFYLEGNLLEVLGANTTGVTNMSNMFYNCTALTTVSLFDTSSVTDMHGMFSVCTALTEVPLLDTSSATNMNSMFKSCSSLTEVPLLDTSSATSVDLMFHMCSSVESGALALYTQASSQINPPSSHLWTFKDCGVNTQTGAAELAQIPSSWGGTGA